MRKVLLLITLIVVLSFAANAQFNSGSTGADGALDLSTNCQANVYTGACEVQLRIRYLELHNSKYSEW